MTYIHTHKHNYIHIHTNSFERLILKTKSLGKYCVEIYGMAVNT